MIQNPTTAVDEPLVSIITVCRNAQATLAEAMASVLTQSYGRIEYIIVDGGSSDGTLDIVRKLADQSGGRVRWISEGDDGIYDAMNKGLRMATGSVIGILNADDQYEPGAIEAVVEARRVHGDGVFYGILRVVDGGVIEALRAVAPSTLYRESIGHPAYFVSRSVYEQHGVFDRQYRFAADYELMLRFHHNKVPFHLIERIVATYRQGGASSVHGLETLLEMLGIRQRYGYLTAGQYHLRAMKYRVLHAAHQWKLRP